jgi:hypothetical protein
MAKKPVYDKDKIKNAVRFFYDLQELRMQSSNRPGKKAAAISLDDDDKAFLKRTGSGLNALEKEALKEVIRLIKYHPVWAYLKEIRGVGPTMAGVLISEIDITRCNTVSQLWAYCGLAVGPDGKAVRKKKGEKLGYNPWLKSKVVKVLGESFIKSCSYDPDIGYCTSAVERDADGKQITYVDENGKTKKKMIKVPFPQGVVPYRKFYDDKKHRRESQLIDKCMACEGTGKVKRVQREEETVPGQKKSRTEIECPNCEGGTKQPFWGASQDHRHKDGVRIMVKQFLMDLWVHWRTIEGLEVRAPYAEEYLGRVHHKSA